MRQLLFRTQGGFANRLRAIVSAVLWAEDLDCELTIYWPVEPGHMPCSLDDLLERSSIPRLKSVHNAYLQSALQVLTAEEMKRVVDCAKKEIRVESYAEFHPDQRTSRGLIVLRGLRVRPELEERADSLWKDIGGKSSWLGVHYRGTDHKKCIRDSPVESFMPYLTQAKGASFLATDEVSVKNMLSDTFNMATVHVPMGRKTVDEQKHGVIEWLLLHKCNRVLQSAGSSYSELVTLRSGGILIKAQHITEVNKGTFRSA